ncbi:hypothetical protein G4G28_00060 [Massilia sp. Dwa41.01b]|uniref:hypothetical protein n=1 Tax=unclassified Massilia TaxID=2609279 RepID=UPI0015FF1733|nr:MULTISPECIES: hypothetical protein [unclassified Massilia]QNA87250.1 hypothetical protein G4G28_00060 [Massilia sp. Dwa41.01b]QNA98155.1 hypothetical protein G4G31_03815 [Massilia sp. Se16.2.3]
MYTSIVIKQKKPAALENPEALAPVCATAGAGAVATQPFDGLAGKEGMALIAHAGNLHPGA